MKFSRFLCFALSLLLVSGLLVACTGDVPEPFEQATALGSAKVNTKVVVQEEAAVEGGEATESVLFEGEVTVTSTSRSTLMLKDLITTLDEDGHIPTTLVYNRITIIENYEANDTHMWFWSLNGNSDVPMNVQVTDGDEVVLIYAEKDAELLTDKDGNVLALTVDLEITAGNDTIYKDSYTVEGTNTISVKEILKTLRDEEGAFKLSVAGSIKSINDYARDDTHQWCVYVDGKSVKPSASVKDKDSIKIVYETIDEEADEPTVEEPAAEETTTEEPEA